MNKFIEAVDSRATFANDVLKLFWYQKFDRDSVEFNAWLTDLYNDFETYVKNLYEVIDTEIPLFAYYQVTIYGNKGFEAWCDFETKQEALDYIWSECIRIYGSY